MVDKIKTIQEALAEVQRNANEAYSPPFERDPSGGFRKKPQLDTSKPGGKVPEVGPVGEPPKPATPKPASGTIKSGMPKPPVGSAVKNLARPAAALGAATVGAGVGFLAGKAAEKLAHTPTGEKVGKWIGDNVPGARAAADAAKPYGDAVTRAFGGTPPQRNAPAAETPKAETPKAPETPKAEPAKEAPKSSFSQAFSAARSKAAETGHQSTGQFEFQGKKFQTNVAGEKYVPMSKQTKVDSESGGKKKMSEENISELSAFGSAFAAARKSGQSNFSFNGKSFSTKMAGGSSAPKPSSGPANNPGLKSATGFPTRDVSPAGTAQNNPGLKSATGFPTRDITPPGKAEANPRMGVSDTSSIKDNPSLRNAPDASSMPSTPKPPNAAERWNASKAPVESESGGKKKKMSEDINPLIAAFLDLQAKNPENMFVEAKKAKKDYDKDGKVESPKDEVWGSRFRAAKAAGKMEEAVLKDPKDPSVQGSGDVTADAPKHVKPTNPERIKNMKDPRDPSVQGSGDVTYKEEVEIEEGRTTGNRSYKGSPDRKRKAVQMALGRKHKDHPDWNERTSPQYSALKLGRQLQKQGVTEDEEVTFTQEEIDHINSFFLEASVAPTRPEVAIGADSTSEKMSQNDVTATAESGKKLRKEEVELDEDSSIISDAADRRKYIALRNMEADSFKKAKASSSPLKKDHHNKMANQHNDAANEIMDKYRSKSNKIQEETLEEGRPKKNPTPETAERDPRKHIQVEAGRAAAGNVVDFHHNDGSKSKITPAMGRKIVSHLNGLKPADRQATVNKMHDSAEGLKV